MSELVWVLGCDPCGTRGRTVRHLLHWLRVRDRPYRFFDWTQLPDAHDAPPSLLILSGSRYSWAKRNVPRELEKALQCMLTRSQQERIPVCGICFGMQSLVALCGGLIVPSEEGFVDRAEAIIPVQGAGKEVASSQVTVHRYHGDVATGPLPSGFRVLARSRRGEIMAVRASAGRWIGFQFHPEMREETWVMLDRVWEERGLQSRTRSKAQSRRKTYSASPRPPSSSSA